MLKICQITSVHPRYDVRISVKECATLAAAGHDVSLIVADDKPDEVKYGVKFYSVGKADSRRARMQQIPQRIYAKIQDLKPDVVHFHDPELMLLGLKLVKHGYKVVYDVHEDLPKQVMDKHWLPKITRPFVSKVVGFLERYCASKFYGVITATPIIEQRFKQYNPNTHSVRNYPILAELNVVDSNWQEREDKLCYIGSISPTRGIKPMVLSLAKSKLVMELAGPFSAGVTLAELQAMQGGEYVNYLGILDRAQITSLLQKVKVGLVTLLPTPSYVESLPIKMFEYMLSGIPVLASNFPLWEDIILKYNCGLLVDPTDPEAIALACKKLLANQDESRQMGENGRSAVLEFFNWEKESETLLKFYS